MGGDLVWTRVPPSEPGWYFRRKWDMNRGGLFMEVWFMHCDLILNCEKEGVEWSGPIPLPKEAPHA